MPRSNGRTTARRVLNSMLSSPWLIREDWLEGLAGLAEEARARGGEFTAEEMRERLRAMLATVAGGGEGGSPEALALDLGVPLGEGLRATVRDGVAIIPVMGPLYHYADAIHDVCGCSSYEQIARAHQAALADPTVGAILLEVDSPGGEVAGCFELAQMIYDGRGVKPTKAYVSDLACSAGYELASSAGEIVIARSAVVGSIGVVMTFLDTSERDAKQGVRRFEILSSQSPNKRPDPQTDAGRAQVQQMLDDLAQVFIEDVARNRGVSVETVLADFGQGGVMVGARAVAAGLADRVGSFEGLLAEMAEEATASLRGIPAAGGISTLSEEPTMATGDKTTPAADTQPANPTPLTTAVVEKDHPAIATELRQAGATAERERILGIEELAPEGSDELVAKAKADASCTVEKFAVDLARSQRAAAKAGADQRRKYLADVQGAEEDLDKPAPSNGDPEGSSDEAVSNRLLTAAGQKPATR